MSLAIFDEAFSKLDGKNQRQMMSFYKKLVFKSSLRHPRKRIAVLEHIDSVVEVDRIGEGARATVVQLKERARTNCGPWTQISCRTPSSRRDGCRITCRDVSQAQGAS